MLRVLRGCGLPNRLLCASGRGPHSHPNPQPAAHSSSCSGALFPLPPPHRPLPTPAPDPDPPLPHAPRFKSSLTLSDAVSLGHLQEGKKTLLGSLGSLFGGGDDGGDPAAGAKQVG